MSGQLQNHQYSEKMAQAIATRAAKDIESFSISDLVSISKALSTLTNNKFPQLDITLTNMIHKHFDKTVGKYTAEG